MTIEAQSQAIPTEPSPPSPKTVDKPPAPEWSLPRRIWFRFVAVYFVILFFPMPLTNVLPEGGEFIEKLWMDTIWLPIDRLVAKFVLRLPGEISHEVNGSGDTLFDYVHMFTIFCTAMIIATIWSGVQRNRKEHVALESAFQIWLRYTLASIMIIYGAIKVVKLQFPTPSPLQLIKTYGDSSPMNLLWTFMGFSTPYTFFAGLMETIPGLLLFYRRTALLGALMSMGVMTNVVLLNFCYDVPVKLFSTHLLVMAFLIALPDVKRLLKFFLKNVSVEPAPVREPFAARWKERTRIVAKSAFIAVFLGGQVYGLWTQAHEYGPAAKQPPMQGAHEVDSFVRDGQEVPPLLTDAKRPRYFLVRGFGERRFVALKMMNGEQKNYFFTLDPEKKTMLLEAPGESEDKTTPYSMRYDEPREGVIEFEGTLEGSAIRVTMHKVKADDSLLMNRGFHWVNEFPFNR